MSKYLDKIKKTFPESKAAYSTERLEGFLLTDGTFINNKIRMFTNYGITTHGEFCQKVLPESENARADILNDGNIRFYYMNAEMHGMQLNVAPTKKQYEFIEGLTCTEKMLVEVNGRTIEYDKHSSGVDIANDIKEYFYKKY
jgi:hypothetical protein